MADDAADGVLRIENNKRLGEKIFAVLRRAAMHCDDAKFVAFAEPKIAKFGLADARCILQDRLENLRQVSGRRADDTQNFRCGRLLLHRLVQFTGEPRDLCFLAGRGGTATAHGLWRIAALWRHRLAASRFNWFAACSGAPSHWLPLGSGRGNLAHWKWPGYE